MLLLNIKRYIVKSEEELSSIAKKNSDGSYSYKCTTCNAKMLKYKYVYGERKERISKSDAFKAVIYDGWCWYSWIIKADISLLKIE